jgi:hypothetical protein
MGEDITPGRIVLYRLNEVDVKRIRPGYGNTARVGEEYPAIVVRVWLDGYGINGQVFLDGPDTLWITSAKEGTEPGQWRWPR